MHGATIKIMGFILLPKDEIRASSEICMSFNRDNGKSPVYFLVCNISSSQTFRLLLYVFNGQEFKNCGAPVF